MAYGIISCLCRSALGLLVGLGIASARAADPTVYFPAPAGERLRLEIHGSTDLVAMEPMVRGFQEQQPDVSIEYTNYLTNELNALAAAACAADAPMGDLLLSSSVDQLVKLVNDGCARPHLSLQTAAVPRWANWRDEVFGFTFEPAVMVYNSTLVPPHEVPHTRAALADLLRDKPQRYEGKIGTYDVGLSGIGLLFAFYDAEQSSTFGRLIESFGRANAMVRCCTGEILDAVERGDVLIGYNMLGSYAYSRLKAGAPIGIVLLRDYTIVLSRGVLIPRQSRHPALAGRFIDYLLSEEGQQRARTDSFFFSADGPLPEHVDGPDSIANSGLFRPIVIGPGLLAVQDRARRQRFLDETTRSFNPPRDD
jgi:iron(III) transport system substrate-binding protein